MNNMRKKIAILIKNENFVVKGLFLTAIILSLVLISPQIAYSLKNTGYGYGYSAGSYGYGYAYSSDLPSAPCTLTCSADSSSAITCTWLTVTTSADGYSLDNFSSYKLYRSNTSPATYSDTLVATVTNQSSGLTGTASGLSAGTAYYFALYVLDDNDNRGAAKISSATTDQSAGGGGGGSGRSIYDVTPTPAPVATVPGEVPGVGPEVAAVVSETGKISNVTTLLTELSTITGEKIVRDTKAERANMSKVVALVKAAGITIAEKADWYALNNFVTYGISQSSYGLGSGERLALVKDAIELIKLEKNKIETKHWTCIDQMGRGEIPAKCRDLRGEGARLSKVLEAFAKFMGVKKPDFKIPAHNYVWNAINYKLRPAEGRNLAKEVQAVVLFKLKMGRNPSNSFDWSVIKALAYWSGLIK